MKQCIIHPESRATVEVNNVELCHECWNKASAEEREWFKKAISMYNRGLLTKKELDDCLSLIGYHVIDPTVPVNM